MTKKDISAASERATKEFATLGSQIKATSTSLASSASTLATTSVETAKASVGQKSQNGEIQTGLSSSIIPPQSTSAMFSVLMQKAQSRIEELEKVEFSKYLNKVGKEVGDFLKDAVTVDPDDTQAMRNDTVVNDVLFDLPEDIKRHIYTTRLDAQLHALHTSPEPFLTDSKDNSFEEFASKFSISDQTETIAHDLDFYDELRKLMEKLVPEKISYEEFWKRYYFLRDQINQEEVRRKQLLKEAGQEEDDFDWSEDEDDEQTTPKAQSEAASISAIRVGHSTSTLARRAVESFDAAETNPDSSRPSSESSYDLVSRTNSQADVRPVVPKVS